MRPNLGKTALAGFAGTLVMTLMMYFVSPMMGGGFFSSKMGGVMAVMGSLMGHAAYGGLLGWIPGPAEGKASGGAPLGGVA